MFNKKKDMIDLSKTLSYMLRHAPWEYELELDAKGFVPIENVLCALREAQPGWAQLTIEDLHTVIEQSDKKRHEIFGMKIRALYGHSTPIKLIKKKSAPPIYLYHGTNPKLLKQIMREGLKPMHRHYVHLSVDLETAEQVGCRKATKPIILTIEAEKAYQNGIVFYQGNDKVWLADIVPPDYIKTQPF